MARDLNDHERYALENLIDDCSLSAVIEALSSLCGEKADHIESNAAADKPLAKRWREAEGHIGCVVASLPQVPGIV